MLLRYSNLYVSQFILIPSLLLILESNSSVRLFISYSDIFIVVESDFSISNIFSHFDHLVIALIFQIHLNAKIIHTVCVISSRDGSWNHHSVNNHQIWSASNIEHNSVINKPVSTQRFAKLLYNGHISPVRNSIDHFMFHFNSFAIISAVLPSGNFHAFSKVFKVSTTFSHLNFVKAFQTHIGTRSITAKNITLIA